LDSAKGERGWREAYGSGHGLDHGGPGDAQDGGTEETSRDGPAHADFAVGEREDLGAVGVGNRPLAGAVERSEDVDEHSHGGEMGRCAQGSETAQTRGEQTPRHVRESEEQQRAAAEGVNGPDGGPGKDEVDETKAK
jgi:hypothetical protein